MAVENRGPIKLSVEDKTAIANAVNVLTTKLQPYLIALSPNERNNLPKINDKTFSFVNKATEYAGTNPEFTPIHIDVDSLTADVNTVAALRSIAGVLEQTVAYLNDTILLTGSEALVASLSYYNSVKHAAQKGHINAKPIHEDLKGKISPHKNNT
jgi:hypothetical protein